MRLLIIITLLPGFVSGFSFECKKILFRECTLLRQSATIDSNDEDDESSSTTKKKIVVIGGGWAGYSAADSVSSFGDTEVLMLDASPRGPGGLAGGGWRTPVLKQPVENGIHGFWRDYRNTFDVIENRIGLDLDSVLTPYTPSILVSESGRVAVAPVLGGDDDSSSSIVSKSLLPPPLDVALLTDFEPTAKLSISDRLSAIGLLGVWADFDQEDPESWKRYDGMSAEQLFLSVAGVSPALYNELITPLLHVLPMTPGYDCSAAAALSCFHVFALASKGAFDVRWCRGSIGEKIFNPWTERLLTKKQGNVKIQGSTKVSSITKKKNDDGTYYEIVVVDNNKKKKEETTTIECDAVILAVGGVALKNINFYPQQPPKLEHIDRFRGVTCVAVRLFIKPSPTPTKMTKDGTSTRLPTEFAHAMEDSPIIVCGPRVIPELAETGFCIYDLQRLQDEFVNEAVLEIDFFRADSFVDQSDEDIVQLALRAVSSALLPNTSSTSTIHIDDVVDFSVVRARNAVSHFDVNSGTKISPEGVKLDDDGLYICGDWVDRTGHASWSTEKAVVTGRQAAKELAKDFKLNEDIKIIPAPKDTPQLQALRQFAATTRKTTGNYKALPRAPWMGSTTRVR